MTTVRTRIAPTPSGNLHLGTTHTALFNYLFSRHSGGKFVLRIDDSDPKRSKLEFEQNIIDSLKWLGLDWDEGPDIGGPYSPYRQSERMDRYWPYIEKLLQEKKAYYCYCTPEELEEERKKFQKEGKPFKYSGKCCNISQDQIKAYEKEGRKPAVRLIVPEKKVSFVDPARGEITVDASQFGDFIIARGDRSALLIVASTIDDIEMEITHTIRGEDYINFIPKQILFFESLGIEPPVFSNLPFVYGPDGSKLSKRHGAVSISEYKDQGYLSEAIFNYLTLLGWSSPDGREILSKDETIKLFTLERLNTNPHRFDITKLTWMNQQYIQKLSEEELLKRIMDHVSWLIDKDAPLVKSLLPLLKERMQTLNDFETLAGHFFNEPFIQFNKDSERKLLGEMHVKLQALSEWSKEEIFSVFKGLMNAYKVRMPVFYRLLTGNERGLPLPESVVILGKEKTIKRLANLLS